MSRFPSIKKMSANYISYHKELLKSKKFMEKLKIGFSIFIFLLSIGFYGYFVNISSTKGYFIKVEREKLSEIKFENEIVKIDTKKIEGEILTDITPSNLNSDELTGKVVIIKTPLKEVVFNDIRN